MNRVASMCVVAAVAIIATASDANAFCKWGVGSCPDPKRVESAVEGILDPSNKELQSSLVSLVVTNIGKVEKKVTYKAAGDSFMDTIKELAMGAAYDQEIEATLVSRVGIGFDLSQISKNDIKIVDDVVEIKANVVPIFTELDLTKSTLNVKKEGVLVSSNERNALLMSFFEEYKARARSEVMSDKANINKAKSSLADILEKLGNNIEGKLEGIKVGKVVFTGV